MFRLRRARRDRRRRIIAGAATVATEAMEQASVLGAVPDLFIATASGGGLSAGCALAIAGSGSTMLAVEPFGFDELARSLSAGRRVAIEGHATSICDALLAPMTGALPFDIHMRSGTKVAVVADNHARAAVSALYAEFGLVTEPGGALSVAALLAEPSLLQGRASIAVASGRNLDRERFISMISEA
ncbi:pyridoxal-phosphate dependent enzyme [Bosea sp. 2RAB26]|uniref:pyridoxal-phosphate dependent enzyme n=1 Tax=Bosea sp. 2RAB26 TaxID=3237476 RepID=UPI003F93629D